MIKTDRWSIAFLSRTPVSLTVQEVTMAYKMKIPASWTKMRPNTAKLPHVYNLDGAVGLDSPNQSSDVMLVQAMLRAWKTGPIDSVGTGWDLKKRPQGLGDLPMNGRFDNRLLGWILYYQLYFWSTDVSMITGKVLPASEASPLDGRHMLLRMNLGLADPRGDGVLGRAPWTSFWLDMSKSADIPAALAAAVKVAR
jgi:hypothetical protein